MANKLSREDIDAMFEAYCKKQSVLSVAKKCSVSKTTAWRYKRLEDWDGRLAAIQRKAQEKQSDSLADCLAQNVKVAQFAKGTILKAIKKATKAGKDISKNPVSDLDKLIRLELLLRGGEDSRDGGKVNFNINQTGGDCIINIEDLDLPLDVRKKILERIREDSEDSGET